MITKNDPLREVIEEEEEGEENESDTESYESHEARSNNDNNKASNVAAVDVVVAPPVDYTDIEDEMERSLALVYIDKWKAAVVAAKAERSGTAKLWGSGGANPLLSEIDASPGLKIMAKKRKMPLVSDLVKSVLENKDKRTSMIAPIKHDAIADEEMKAHVYKKALQALIYPISNVTPHVFQQWSATTPTSCNECTGLMWGLSRGGFRCAECGIKCHEKCKDLLDSDCLQRAVEKNTNSNKQGTEERANALKNVIQQKMEDREKEKPEVFDLIKSAFAITDADHDEYRKTAVESVLSGNSKWSARIHVTVVSAKGLTAKDQGGTSDPYVTIQVGRLKKRTRTLPKTLDPAWNQKFLFKCHNSSDKIKVRVWDEDNDFNAKIRQKFTSEADEFLGQAIIDVRTLSGDMDDWYNLTKRTEKSEVTGAVRLRITIDVKGEENVGSYHQQYRFLHENLFNYLCNEVNNGDVVIPNAKNEDAWKLYFDKTSQDVVDEFSLRFGIEQVYEAMVHFECLATKYLSPAVPDKMSLVLDSITIYYSETAVTSAVTAWERFSACNFGKDRFTKLLENLYNSIKMDLNMYRQTFPSSNPDRLYDLRGIIRLLISITEFRSKILGLVTLPASASVVTESVKNCLKTTYEDMYGNVETLYKQQFVVDPKKEEDGEGPCSPGNLTSLEFWHKLIALLVNVIEEDKTSYKIIHSLFPDVLNMGDLSAWSMWIMLAEDLDPALQQHEKQMLLKPTTYLSLLFKVKWLYTTYVKTVPELVGKMPDYPRWFKPFVMKWFDENDITSMDFLRNAMKRDEDDGWQLASEFSLFSVSVVDVFTNLSQTQDVIIKLQTPDPEIQKQYNKRFTKTMIAVLTGYDDAVTHDFLKFVQEEKTCIIVMNNLNQLRIEMDRMKDCMGIGQLDDETLQMLHDMNQSLVNRLDALAIVFASSFERSIQQKFVEVASQLATITGPGTTEQFEQLTGQQDVISEADFVLTPLMDLLDGKLSLFSQICEETVLKRLLKELWKQVIDTLEKTTIRPPTTRRILTIQGLKQNINMRKFSLNRSASNVSTEAAAKAAEGNLTPRQCAVLHVALETIKQYFHAGGHGLDDEVLEKTSELRSLRYALSLFTQTTDNLIRTFIACQGLQNLASQQPEGPIGEIKFQVDLYPDLVGSGDHEITVKIINCSNVLWPAKFTFKPYVEITLMGPDPGRGKAKRFWTKCKASTSPEFDESFTIKIAAKEKLESYEIQLNVRDYYIARQDRLIGVFVLQLQDVVKKGTWAKIVPLSRRVYMDETGCSILRILSQRTDDDAAQEFFKLKSAIRVDPPVSPVKEVPEVKENGAPHPSQE